MDERKTKLMHLLYVFIVAVGDALHVSGVFPHRQERLKTKSVGAVTPAASTRFAPPPPPAQRPQHTAQNTYATDLVF
jgi:hypothetical protein